MKKIEIFERAIAEKAANLKDYNINGTLFWAYRECEQTGNEHINFSEVIWEKEIEEIANSMKEYGITEFTISSTFSGLISTLAEFEKHGIKMQGLTEVKERYKNIFTGERDMIPAIRMTVE